ncbi:MAG: CHAP domain-containing protein [Ktedonobacterales bacterium]|nr:CHAP domain-containing protein [Ktedonobacterales bacterium]
MTGAMRALTQVHGDATAVVRAIHTSGDDDATVIAGTVIARPVRSPVRVVPGRAAGVRIPASPALRKRHPQGRRVFAGLVTLAASVAMVVGMLYASSPMGGARMAAQSLELVAAAGDNGVATSGGLGGAWATSAGALSLGIGGGAGPGVKAPGTAGLPVKNVPKPPVGPPPPPPPGIGISPAPFTPWPPANQWMQVPGYGAFAAQPVAGYYSSAFGQCTWWAQYERRDETLAHMGNARYWGADAIARGYRVGDRPAPNTTVVFQPGVQGAGGGGHVAHVIAVYPGGWFLMSEMNFYWNGGGLGRVDYRYAHSGWGVQFIY